MARVQLFACHAGLLASVVSPEFSLTLSFRSAAAGSQENRLGSQLSVGGTPPTAEDKTDGEP